MSFGIAIDHFINKWSLVKVKTNILYYIPSTQVSNPERNNSINIQHKMKVTKHNIIISVTTLF